MAASSSPLQPSSNSGRRELVQGDGAVVSSDWLELTSHQNRTYFMHLPTGRGQWNRPAVLADLQQTVEVQNVGESAGGGQGSGAATDDPATYADAELREHKKV
jgi:hypothetical protein